jgi:hypothetical protein
MEKMSESRMHEVVEQAGKEVYEADGMVVWLSNEVVPGAIWTKHEVEIVGKIHSKLRLVQMILNGDTTAEDFGLQK